MKVTEECLDGFSKFEMQAYADSMKASYLIEAQKWQEALDLLLSSKVIYQKIASYKDSLEAVIYQEKIGQIDTFLRLCCLNLNLKSSADLEASLEKKKSKEIQEARLSTKKEQIENIQEIKFGGKSIPLKSERLRLVFKRVENQATEIEQMTMSEPEKKVQAYLKFVNVIDDAQIVIKKEKAEELKKSE